jgi:hypothetical protein
MRRPARKSMRVLLGGRDLLALEQVCEAIRTNNVTVVELAISYGYLHVVQVKEPLARGWLDLGGDARQRCVDDLASPYVRFRGDEVQAYLEACGRGAP